MHVITLNFNPLDCSCWALSSEEYCVYCNLVCEATLEDYECGVGYWTEVGGTDVSHALDDRDHADAMAEFFEEGHPPTPTPSGSRGYPLISPLENYLADLGEEAPWRIRSIVSRVQKAKVAKGKKPYARPPKKVVHNLVNVTKNK